MLSPSHVPRHHDVPIEDHFPARLDPSLRWLDNRNRNLRAQPAADMGAVTQELPDHDEKGHPEQLRRGAQL